MNTLRALRGGLQEVLERAGSSVLDFLPERIVPPIALIASGSPYVEAGSSFGSFNVRFTVVLVCPTGTNETSTQELDSLVTATVVALHDSPWGLERVDQPSMLAHGGTNFLSTTIDVTQTVTGIADDGGEP